MKYYIVKNSLFYKLDFNYQNEEKQTGSKVNKTYCQFERT
jgi:hypothetical protein